MMTFYAITAECDELDGGFTGALIPQRGTDRVALYCGQKEEIAAPEVPGFATTMQLKS